METETTEPESKSLTLKEELPSNIFLINVVASFCAFSLNKPKFYILGNLKARVSTKIKHLN